MKKLGSQRNLHVIPTLQNQKFTESLSLHITLSSFLQVNSAMATNRRMANQVAAIIVRNSLLVSHSAHSTHSTLSSEALHANRDKPQNTFLSRHSPSHDNPEVNTNTSHLLNDSYNSPTHIHQTLSRLQESETLHAGQRLDREASLLVGIRGSAEREGVRSVAEAIRTTNRPKSYLSSDEENVRHSTILETQQVGVESERGTLPKNKKLVKGPMFTLRSARKQKVWCDSDARYCSGQNSFPVQIHNTTSDEDKTRYQQSIHKVTNSYINYKKEKNNELHSNKTHLDHERLSFTDTERKLKHMYLPESTVYEPIDSDVTDLVSRKNDSTRKRSPSPHFSEEQLRKLPVCPEIPPGLRKYSWLLLHYQLFSCPLISIQNLVVENPVIRD